jgi:hypothetical protein
MKYLVIAAATVALAACSKPAPAPEATSEAATETPAAAATVANGSPTGAFEVTSKDGTVRTATINPDGTYTDTDASGKVVEEGSWAVKDGKTCFTPTTAGAEAMCFTESAPGADGSFTATPDNGDPVTVKPKAAATPAPAAS